MTGAAGGGARRRHTGGLASVALVATAVATTVGACAHPSALAEPRPAVRSAWADGALGATSSPAEPRPGVTASTASEVPMAQAGREASSQRRTFVPTRIRLVTRSQGESSTTVIAVDTAPNGELGLPSNPGVVGWWQSGALAGDPFGSVVLAGHIDSRTQGLGFFVRLLGARPGDTVDLADDRLTQAYRVVSNRSVDKGILSSATDTFSQRVAGRLVLITCAGPYDSVSRHYRDNLVVTAEPVGVAVPAP